MRKQLDKNLGLFVWCSGIVIVAAALILLANLMFGGFSGDVTADRRYSLDDKTVSFLETNQNPITVRLYITKNLAEQNPTLGRYADYVRRLLTEYQRKSGDLIDVSVVEVVPFLSSQAAAEKAGLKTFDFGDDNKYLYLGASFTNTKGQTLTIPKFLPERERNVEDDISRILSFLVSDKKPVLGVISPFFKVVDATGWTENWPFVKQLKGFGYQVKSLGGATSFIPKEVDAVLVFYPQRLDKETVYALDQYLLSGGNIMIVFDAFSEERFSKNGQYTVYNSGLQTFLQNKGVEYVDDLLVGDLSSDRELELNGKKIKYPFWLTVKRDNADLLMNHSGYFKYQEQLDIVTKVLAETSDDSVIIKAGQVPNVGEEDLERYYENSTAKYPLALLLEGTFQSVFDKSDAFDVKRFHQKSEFLPMSVKMGKLVLISDADMFNALLWDANALSKHDFYETIFISDNMHFMREALDYLTDNGYVGVKSKNSRLKKDSLAGVFRHYTKQSFRPEQQQLTDELFAIEEEMNTLKLKMQKVPVSSVKQSKDLEQLQREKMDLEYKSRQISYLMEERVENFRFWFLLLVLGVFPVMSVLILSGAYTLYRNMMRRKAEKNVNA